MTSVLTASRPARAGWRLVDQFVRYALLGGCGALVDFVVFALLTHGTGMPAVPANVTSVLCGIGTSFLLNSRWTFPSGRDRRAELVKFVTVGLVGLLASSVAIGALVHVVHAQAVLAKALVVPAVALGQFLANRRWTFGAHQLD